MIRFNFESPHHHLILACRCVCHIGQWQRRSGLAAVLFFRLQQLATETLQSSEAVRRHVLDHRIVYCFGLLNALSHFIVGVVWEQVSLPRGPTALLSLPYFGGYLVLLSVALALVFVYLHLSLRLEPSTPIHIRKFSVVLSGIVSIGSLIVLVVLGIRTSDYAKEKDQFTKSAYESAVVVTILDFVFSFFLLPPYFYLLTSHIARAKTEEEAHKGEVRSEEVKKEEIQTERQLNNPVNDEDQNVVTAVAGQPNPEITEERQTVVDHDVKETAEGSEEVKQPRPQICTLPDHDSC